MSKLVLIDGNAIMHRAYHALPPLTTKSGEPINAVYGFVSMILRVITDLDPTHVAIAFDRKEPTFRRQMHEAYQAQRPEMEADLDSQFPKAKDVAKAMGIPIYEKVGFEADDVIGTIAKKSKVGEVVIVTGDKDILQLVDRKIKVYLPARGLSDATLMNEAKVKEKMGVMPAQIVDYKALVGDPSDNYKGVPGIGPKTAISLLSKFGGFRNVFKNLSKVKEPIQKKLKVGRESGEMSLRLAKIVTNVPGIKLDLTSANDWGVDRPEVVKLFVEYGFKSLTTRVQKMGGSFSKKDPSFGEIKKVAKKIAQKLAGKQYAIRGTASLKLQGYEMGVDDIDVLADKDTALAANKILKDFLVEKVAYKKLDQFKSYFGKFVIDEILVEVYGDWWVGKKFYNASDNEVIEVDGIRLTSVETELAMYAAMGRWTAYHKLKGQVEKKNQGSLF
ncbi:hypothetical protein A2630_01410 [Candidatus Woesebacteria bacterium RIFCSPHIGHO2_01_FULL_44_10]|uniref:5'-3' exonuclease domain-containing protein n=1 Tax=Candidatus Woesebacteria bacterium RIFCSPLOWO2_01_FULL_44_14 TaxID=1802525 RepID=A0A1F8BWP7_9BACT|nr:MAG: hypothetical protein A2630_01410 [Candidatus Woesebacteria bacterium RIFCSPHIGHO2_01_FULL_44_10]OGM56095.1 MAG: hypothetical protein A3F62_05655 [Candidatus Woesebacteria bacterium RIFCSPHIGHO2_12_FULL_44_11]OGM68486.1 MAG: hypothetical protein A2975_03135 [Candidatus Woesebacteria bacterium RIFCSPLOWO2_01_FULL_44_14]